MTRQDLGSVDGGEREHPRLKVGQPNGWEMLEGTWRQEGAVEGWEKTRWSSINKEASH